MRTTMDNSTTVQYASLLHSLAAQARNCVRDTDPQNDLTFLRVRSKKHEIMIAPGKPTMKFFKAVNFKIKTLSGTLGQTLNKWRRSSSSSSSSSGSRT